MLGYCKGGMDRAAPQDCPERVMRMQPAAQRRLRHGVIAVLNMVFSAAAISQAHAANPAPPAVAGGQTLEIDEYAVRGNHLLSEDEAYAAIAPYLGPGQTVASVNAARAALQKAFVQKGYQTVAVEIPPQHVTGGVVILQVVEEPIGRLHVKGSRYFSLAKIKEQAPSLAPGQVPNFKKIPHDLVVLNSWPDRQVVPALRAGAVPRTVDVDLNVKDQLPLHATLEMDNRYSQSTTPLRINGSLTYDNLWQRGDTISFNFQTAPQDPSNALVFSGSYLARVPDADWLTLLLYGLVSNSNVSTVGAINVVGKGQVVGVRGIATLPGAAGFYDTLSAGVDYKHFDQDVILNGSTGATPLTYYPISATYSASWQGNNAQTHLDLTPTFSIRGFGSNPDAFDAKRFDAEGGFFYLRMNLTRTQELPKGFELFGRAQGQVSNEPLANSEEFSGGGQDTVRGYLESEVLGDDAILGSVELRTPSLGHLLGPKVDSWRFFTFAEGGELTALDPLPEQQAIFDLASVGIGTNIELIDHLNGQVDVALPLVTSVATKAGQPRVEFRVWVEF